MLILMNDVVGVGATVEAPVAVFSKDHALLLLLRVELLESVLI